MHERELQIFIDGATNFFSQVAGEAATVGTPYLISNHSSLAMGFTGVIGVSGVRRGSVYFTAAPVLLKVLLTAMGETESDTDAMSDLVGEIANTISGNARREFGKDFMISVPVVFAGKPERISVPEYVRSFVIPISWRNYEAALVISME